MIWYFTRGAAHIDLEVHRLGGSTGYTFAVTYPDGAEQIESFSDPARLVTRVLSFQQKLIADGWMPSSTDGGPVSLGRRPIRRRQMYLRVRAEDRQTNPAQRLAPPRRRVRTLATRVQHEGSHVGSGRRFRTMVPGEDSPRLCDSCRRPEPSVS